MTAERETELLTELRTFDLRMQIFDLRVRRAIAGLLGTLLGWAA